MSSSGIRKLYYSISEVADMTGLKPHVLRYWESEFEELDPKKNRAGNRVYTERDVQLVHRISGLLRDRKFTIEGARQELASESGQEAFIDLPVDDLRELRSFLAKMRASLEQA